MTPTLQEACAYFAEHGGAARSAEELLRNWPPTCAQLRNAAEHAITIKHRPRDEVERMTAGIIFGQK